MLDGVDCRIGIGTLIHKLHWVTTSFFGWIDGAEDILQHYGNCRGDAMAFFAEQL